MISNDSFALKYLEKFVSESKAALYMYFLISPW